MANRVVDQKVIDTNKRTLMKYVIVSDGSGTANSTLTLFKDLAYAINATGQISSTNPKSSYGVTVKRIYGVSNIQSASGYILLNWMNDANSLIVAVKSGNFDFNMIDVSADHAVISSPAANTTGLGYSIASPTTGDVVTLFVELRKDSRDYDAGQTADPYAFNRIP